MTASPKFLVAMGLFVVGAFVGSLAPVFSMVGSNPYLLKLLLQTWQTDLFTHGWWPWSLAGGIAATLTYVLWRRKSAPD